MWDALKCNFCGDCLAKCQYTGYKKEKAIDDFKLLVQGKEADILKKCIACMACSEYCLKGADPFDLICKMQEKTGVSPMNIDEYTLLSHPIFNTPSKVIKGDPDKPALNICLTESFTTPDVISGQLFEGMTIVKGHDYFCYFDWLRHGKESLVKKYAGKFIDSLSDLNKDIIFFHDDCYSMVHTKVRDYGITVPFKYMHILEYLRNYLSEHKNKIIKLNKRIASQRACSSRYTPEKYALLDEIFELIGVERVEREYDRVNSLCCFAVCDTVFPAQAADYRAKNLKDAADHGGEALITVCPGCNLTFKNCSLEYGLNTIHITDLCRIALGEKPWPKRPV
jgi:Fe-S oxidoreductase